MPEPILHHFDLSPFAEKARLTLGLKGLTWQSVQIPMVMPKPDLMPLTGGYRKTPVLQIGADVYCDTNLIARELERRVPQPTLFPSGQAGIAQALSSWADKAFFEPGAALAMGVNRELPEALLADRKQLFAFMDFSRLDQDIPHLYTQLRAHASFVDAQLSDGRPYLLAAQPGLADINAYFVVWMARGIVPPVKELFAPFAHMEKWEARMGSIGHGKRSEIEALQALQIARSSTAEPPAGVDPNDPLQLRARARVSVTPDDYGKVAVTGELATLQIHEVAVRRLDPRAGEIVVHFPRIGYRVALA
jgi:glutathione S-transferase